MKNQVVQNGVELRTEYINGLSEAVLISETRIVEIYRNHGGSWSISLSKRVVDEWGSSNVNLRTYTNVTMSEALAYFDNKQHEYGFFNN